MNPFNDMNSEKLRIIIRSKIWLRLITALAAGFILSASNIITSCSVIDPDEPIPAYISINKIDLTVNPVYDGTSSSKITDAWVYCDGSLVGVYELPCKFPILKEGEHDIIIKAGIKMNGIAASRGYYPFYTNYETQLNLVPGETIELNPSVTYYPDKVHYKEGFEDGGVTLEAYGDSDTTILKTNVDSLVWEGAYSGIIKLNSAIDYVQIATIDPYEIPTIGTPVFLEMNYKTDNLVDIGLIADVSGSMVKTRTITLNPNTSWNKIYINLTYTAASQSSASNFKLYFEVSKDVSLTEATVLLDNLKLVYN
jgi:hypothetical protein